MVPTIFCMRYIPSGTTGVESSVLIGYFSGVPYLFGTEGYEACCVLFVTSCLYFSVV